MSLSSERHEAPPILGPLDFADRSNQIILIEHDEENSLINLLSNVIHGKSCLWFSPRSVYTKPSGIDATFVAFALNQSSISNCHKMIKAITAPMDFMVLQHIDEMNLTLDRRQRGAQISAYLSMLASKNILRGGNLIVSSCQTEYAIRGIANLFLNLRRK